MNRKVLYSAAFLLLAAGILTIVTAATMKRRQPDSSVSKMEVQPVDAPSEWMTEYTLTERSGRQFHSQALAGKAHVVNFFFATCPSVCRRQSGKVDELAREFGPRGVVFLSITCDPDRDTPAALQEYAKIFNADPEQWLFLTSPDLTYLRRVGAEMYQLPVDKQTHSESLVVVDKWGELRGRFHFDRPEQLYEMKKVLEQLLAEEVPPSPTSAGPTSADTATADQPGNDVDLSSDAPEQE